MIATEIPMVLVFISDVARAVEWYRHLRIISDPDGNPLQIMQSLRGK